MDKFIECDQTKIYYRVSGNGYPIVFLHGFLESSNIWESICKQLEQCFKVIVIDLPGHGKSNCPQPECTMSFMAKCVFKVLERLDIVEKSTVFGHSLGGYVGLELTKLMQIKLVLVHSNFWADTSQKKLDRNRVIEIVAKEKIRFIKQAIPNLFLLDNRERNSDNIEKLIIEASQISVKNIQAVTRGMMNRKNNETCILSEDVIIVQGDFDPIIPLNKMTEAISKLKINTEIEVIKNCGHMGFLEQKEYFSELITKICTQAKNEIIYQKTVHFK